MIVAISSAICGHHYLQLFVSTVALVLFATNYPVIYREYSCPSQQLLNTLLTAIFQDNLVSGTRMSPFWILLDLRMMEVVSGDNCSYKTCKAPVKLSPTTHQHPAFSGRCPSCRQTNKLCERPPQYAPSPCKLTCDLLTSKVVSESRVTWATSVPILVFLGLSVLKLDPMYATDRTSD